MNDKIKKMRIWVAGCAVILVSTGVVLVVKHDVSQGIQLVMLGVFLTGSLALSRVYQMIVRGGSDPEQKNEQSSSGPENIKPIPLFGDLHENDQ